MNLKKLTAFSMAAVLSLSLFGCSAQPKEDTTLSRYIDEKGYIKDVDTAAVNLVDYNSLVIPADQHTPDETAISAWMNYQLPSQKVYEGEVYDGATLNIDYVGYIDGIAFPGGDTNGMGTEVTIGVTQYIDDFLQQLVGHQVGEDFDIEVTFPEDYHNTELAGKDATFMIIINYLVEPIAARDLTDEVVKDALGDQGIETVEAFREQAIATLSAQMTGNFVYAEIFEKSTVEPVAQTAVDFQTDYIVMTTTAQAEAYGITLEELLEMYGMGTVEEFTKSNAEVIESAAKELCITQAIAEKEGITVEKADIKEYFGGQDYSNVEKVYGENFVKFIVLQSKTLDHLTANIAKG
ncbi:MAG: FKBP-type peptidyl-prolyl cis-trans isomerase [Oscillospiraceae bacterium]|nr:FKBP-type peptidyl-prolyl cis-trans isomerase [Oscillospiraceae bacterium]